MSFDEDIPANIKNAMADFGIEDFPHNYGTGPNNTGNHSAETNDSPHKRSQQNNLNGTRAQSNADGKIDLDSGNKTTEDTTPKQYEVKDESPHHEKKLALDKDFKSQSKEDKKQGTIKSMSNPSEQIKETASVKSIPDLVSETEKEKRIFELTETEKDGSANLAHNNSSKETNKTHSNEPHDTVSKENNFTENKNFSLGSEKTAYSILEITSQCSEHNDDFIFICDRCDVPVCRTCVVREHKGHKLSDIEETATSRENALANVLTPRIAGAVRNSSEMSLNLSTFDSEISEINRAIQQHGEAIKEAVDRQVLLMTKNVKEKSSRRKTKYLELNRTLEDAVKKGKSLQKRHQDLTNSKNDGALILQLKRLTQDAKNFDYPPVPSFPSVKYNAPKIVESDIAALFGSFSFM